MLPYDRLGTVRDAAATARNIQTWSHPMSRIVSLAVCGAAAALAFAASHAQAQEKKSKCVMAGGEATMITGDLARFMANAALTNSIKGMAARGAGAVKMTCKDGLASVTCLAQQRACK